MRDQDWFSFSVLILATGLSVFLVAGNNMYQDRLDGSLLWNLCLAWIPLLIALVARLLRLKRFIPILVFLGTWLLFWPNSLYMLTDLVHLTWLDEKGLWLDLLTILASGMTGLFAGLMSLVWMQSLVQTKFGSFLGWLFALGAFAAGGFGVYIGRFLHLNSWNALEDPFRLFYTIRQIASDEWGFIHMTMFSAIFGLIFLFVYIMMVSAPGISEERD